MTGLRVMTYNVHRGGDDREAVATVLSRCAPDIVMVQEAPVGLFAARDRARLADAAGLHHLTGAIRTAVMVADPDRWRADPRWIRRPLIRRYRNLRVLQLPNGAIAARTTAQDGPITVIGCHLGLHNRGRLDELRQVLAMAPSGEPRLVVGDINEPVGGPVWRAAADAGLVDSHAAVDRATFPAAAPRHRIDVIWTSPGMRTAPVDPLQLGITADLLRRASDHLPVIVDVLGAADVDGAAAEDGVTG